MTIELGVPGMASRSPVLAAQSPLVAVAFVASDARGARVYLATSADNGATFTKPAPVPDEAPGDVYDDLSIAIQAIPQGSGRERGVKVQWRRADGQTASTVVTSFVRDAGLPNSPAADAPGDTAIASCEQDGEVLLVAGFKGSGPVSVNHAVSDQSCDAGPATAVVDAREWVHVAWVGGQGPAAQVFYAGSPDRDWFGQARSITNSGQSPANVRIATDPNDTIVAVWDAEEGTTRHVLLRQILPAHHGPPTLLPLTHLTGVAGGVEPSIASIDGGVIVGWRVPSTGAVAVRRVGLDAICDATAIAVSPIPSAPRVPR